MGCEMISARILLWITFLISVRYAFLYLSPAPVRHQSREQNERYILACDFLRIQLQECEERRPKFPPIVYVFEELTHVGFQILVGSKKFVASVMIYIAYFPSVQTKWSQRVPTVPSGAHHWPLSWICSNGATSNETRFRTKIWNWIPSQCKYSGFFLVELTSKSLFSSI